MKFLVWDEPLTGIRENGTAITCGWRVYITEHDAACLARAKYVINNKSWEGISHEDLVTDVLVENWAMRVDVPSLP
jgi:hypothetical protein